MFLVAVASRGNVFEAEICASGADDGVEGGGGGVAGGGDGGEGHVGVGFTCGTGAVVEVDVAGGGAWGVVDWAFGC